jgi:tRNA G46 methylase TrmB
MGQLVPLYGVEVHKPGIGAALIKLEEKRVAAAAAGEGGDGEGGGVRDEWVDNVRLIRMDALWWGCVQVELSVDPHLVA